MTRKKISIDKPIYKGVRGFARAAKVGFGELGHQAGRVGKKVGKGARIAAYTSAPKIRRGIIAGAEGIKTAHANLTALNEYLKELKKMRIQNAITKQEYEVAVLKLKVQAAKLRAEREKLLAQLPPSRSDKLKSYLKTQMTTNWDEEQRARERLENL